MVVVFSGSETSKLEDVFGDLPVWLAAENGVFVRPPPPPLPQQAQQASQGGAGAGAAAAGRKGHQVRGRGGRGGAALRSAAGPSARCTDCGVGRSTCGCVRSRLLGSAGLRPRHCLPEMAPPDVKLNTLTRAAAATALCALACSLAAAVAAAVRRHPPRLDGERAAGAWPCFPRKGSEPSSFWVSLGVPGSGWRACSLQLLRSSWWRPFMLGRPTREG